ncbi:MAG: AMP-binding protein [Deltaproteobacteria bacterium]
MLAEQLRHWAEKQPDKTALQLRDSEGAYSTISYRDLYQNCLKLKLKLESMGYKPGDRISVYGDNSPDWVISYIAVHFAGVILVPLDALLGPQDIFNFLSFSEAKAVITDQSHIDKLKEELTTRGSDIEVIPMESIVNGSEEKRSGEPHIPDPDDLVAILFTSGTTGTPKGVQLSNNNVFGNVRAILKSVDVRPRDNILNILPLHHGYSSIVALLSPLWAGATVTFSESIKSTDLIACIRETKVTIFPGVPRLFELLYNEIDSRVRRLPLLQKTLFKSMFKISEFSWKSINVRLGKLFFGQIHEPFGGQFRFFTSGGAKLDPKIYSSFLSLGFKIAEGYGLTETSAVSTLTSPDNPNPGSAGKPLPGVEIRIDNPEESGTGEVCIRGPNVTRGYYKNESATNELIRNGWLFSGDLGRLDSGNNLFITGRAKEVIVLPSGKNIYPEDVENLYKKSSLIKELCVIPSKSDSGSIKGLGMVVVPDMKEARDRDVLDIRERIRTTISMTGSSLPSYMQISEVLIYTDELPKTRLGKFRRGEIEEIAAELKAGEQPRETFLTPKAIELLNKPEALRFLKHFTEITEVEGPFHPSDDLTLDLGLDSLTLVEITALLEKEFGVLITERDISDIRTIGDILKRLPESQPTITEEDRNLKTLFEREETESIDDIFNLNRGIFKRAAMRIIQILVRVIVKITFRASIKKVNKIPRNKAVLICPNHQSFIDPVLIFALLPGDMLEKLLFTGFGEYFSKPPLSWIVHPLRVILTGTSRTYADSLRLASQGLRRGMSVCIFPEGARTSTGSIMEPRIGTGLLSVETNTPIIPIYIDGATKTLSPVNPDLNFPKVTLTVMDPIEPAVGKKDAKDLYQETVNKWMEEMKRIEENTGR